MKVKIENIGILPVLYCYKNRGGYLDFIGYRHYYFGKGMQANKIEVINNLSETEVKYLHKILNLPAGY